MTIEDKIRDQKIQYDINREAAKISALSSGKIEKYEYLTVEEIFPFNQQQMIEPAKFNYSPLGKAFEKPTETIKDQAEKEIAAIQDNKKQVDNINNDYKNKLLLSKEREIVKNIYNERLDRIEELNKKFDYNNLKYTVKSTGEEFEFDKSEDPLAFSSDIKTGKISVEEVNNLQKDYNEYLTKIRKVNKSVEQKKTLAIKGTGLKILTPKQMLQRLPIALPQIKGGNNSESLLNENRQIFYLCINKKKITKEVYNNIIKSINV